MDGGFGGQGRTLESRFTDLDTPVLLTGIQALVRVLLEQARLDQEAGHRTAGFVSGYRGSPLGGLDKELWQRAALLKARNIRFEPGLNEDLAATMVWGTQQLDAFPGKQVEGVFGMWYGKGPGVDRSGDALRAANLLGTSRLGGVLAVAGDDHAAHSSTFPHQTDQIFQAVMMPVLQPADVGEIVEFGLAGYALSRYAGVWVALKTIAETAEQAATVVLPPRRAWAAPADFALPPHGLNYDPHLRLADRGEIERRLVEERLPAVRAWARANRLDRLRAGSPASPVALVTVGKAHHDAMHALAMLGLAGDPRIAVLQAGLSWPIETETMRAYARGRRLLVVIEEKRGFVEPQLRDALYNLPADERPPVVGKADLAGARLLPETWELSPSLVAGALARVLPPLGIEVRPLPAPPPPERTEGILARAPIFCAGCPHSTSTRVPEGSYATAGIGCHFLALDPEGTTRTFSHMGGEGVHWVGLAPYTEVPHSFANMGDGTYQHSGLLAIRQAVAAGTRMTYKLLVNDAVAMTGGQPAEGGPTTTMIARQVAAEGVQRIAVVADDPARLPAPADLPSGTTRHAREELDAVQRSLRSHEGVSVLIYDQVCATEKRRRRKRGTMPRPEVSVAINERVCENCGDCTAQAPCIAVEPVETEYGRKRRISPTSCNTDLSCLKGFCPSFVTSRGAAARDDAPERWRTREAAEAATLTQPVLPAVETPWRGLFAGIGGGGIVTTGAVVAMAAHLEGRQVSTLDFTGLAQKNGAVVSHVQICDRPIGVARIPDGAADVVLAADLAVAASADLLRRYRPDSAVIGNLDLQPSAAFLGERDLVIDSGLHRRAIERRARGERSHFLRASALAERLFGNTQALNTMLLGIAWQHGLVPVGEAALLRALELNGTAVELNRRAFLWGRLLAGHPALADEILAGPAAPPPTLEALAAAREAELVAYQGRRLAARYRALTGRAASREAAVAGAPGPLARAVAEGYFRVLAYKDEYEVARLHASASYGPQPVFHLAPPLLARRDPATGRARKVAVPGWLALPLFRALRHGRRLRGTPLDPFGRQEERRRERTLIAEYERDIDAALEALRPDTLHIAVELARLPLAIRGYGPVKAASAEAAAPRRAALRRSLAPEAVAAAAE